MVPSPCKETSWDFGLRATCCGLTPAAHRPQTNANKWLRRIFQRHREFKCLKKVQDFVPSHSLCMWQSPWLWALGLNATPHSGLDHSLQSESNATCHKIPNSCAKLWVESSSESTVINSSQSLSQSQSQYFFCLQSHLQKFWNPSCCAPGTATTPLEEPCSKSAMSLIPMIADE